MTTTAPMAQHALHQPESRLESALVPAVEITRGDSVESVHYAAAAVVDGSGTVLAAIGDPHYVTFSRSSLKPFQALATVMRGFPERFGLDERHLALACASHSGEPHHIALAQDILTAIGAGIADLQCGTHIPIYMKSDDGNIPPKSEFSAIHNNCSGKHSTMLALARILDADPAEYLKYDGPVQTEIREKIVNILSLDPAKLAWAIDGCSAPNYAMPLSALAVGFARYACAVTEPKEELREDLAAGAKIARAMMKYPEIVSGTGRFDLQLVEAAGHRIFSKVGGEAVQCVGIPSRGWGIAVKIADGSPRAIAPLVVSILDQLGVIDEPTAQRLRTAAHPGYKNVRGTEIGTARVIARLQSA